MLENNLFKALFDVIPFGIYAVDVNNYEIVYMNKLMSEGRGDLTGKKCYKSMYFEDSPCYYCKMKELINSEGKPIDKTIMFEHFNPVDDNWYQLQDKCITWPDGRVVKYTIAVNINELKATQNRLAEAHAQLTLKNKELEKLSITDGLTLLYNRLRAEEILKAEIRKTVRYKRDMAVLMLDVDHFKIINDTMGHQVGDIVLKELAQLIKNNIRGVDYASRWGGEEFLLVCPETNLLGAKTLAESLRRSIEKYKFPMVSKVTCSIGLSVYKEGDDEKNIIERADKALYKAKQSGRNEVEEG